MYMDLGGTACLTLGMFPKRNDNHFVTSSASQEERIPSGTGSQDEALDFVHSAKLFRAQRLFLAVLSGMTPARAESRAVSSTCKS